MAGIRKTKGEGISTTHPSLVSELHPTKNPDFNPATTSSGSEKKPWWRCSKGHEWQAIVSSRARGAGCPYCAGQKVFAGFNDLASVNPALAAEWDYEKNSPLTPEQVQGATNSDVFWLCPRGHSFKAKISNRSHGKGCPFCAGQKVLVGFNDLATIHPHLAAEWDFERNAPLTPEQVSAGSGHLTFWICPRGHSYQSQINNRRQGTSCPFCSGSKVLVGFNDLTTSHPQLAEEWDYERNSPITPQQVSSGTPKSYYWLCKSGHSFKSSLNSRSAAGRGCPICVGQKVLVGFNDLGTKSPELSAEWDFELNFPLTPQDVPVSTARKFWWRCTKGHSFIASLAHRSNGKGCPICAGQKVLAGFNDLATSNPDLAAQWDYEANAQLTPQAISSGSNKKVYWLCPEGHSYAASPANRSVGTACPRCAKFGFDSTQPGLLYFIQNEGLRARKVGITNISTRIARLKDFASLGWTEIMVYQDESGRLILNAETAILKWIRKDLELPAFLSKEDMGRHGGQSETFSIDGPTNLEVISKIEDVLRELRA